MLYFLQHYLSRYFSILWAEPKKNKQSLKQYSTIKKEFQLLKKSIYINNETILIIKVDDIGDFLLFVESFNEYAQSQSNKQIHLLINTVCLPLAEILISKNIRLIPFDKALWFNQKEYRQQIAKKLIEIKAGHVLFASFTRMPLLEGIMMLLFEPNTIYCWKRYAEPNELKVLIDEMNNAGNLFESNQIKLHETEINRLYFSNVLNAVILSDGGINKEIKQTDIQLPENYIVLCMGGNQKSKRYHVKNYIKLYSLIQQKYNHLQWVIVGSSHDIKSAAIFTQNVKNVLNLCGKTSLPQLLSVCKRATIFIGNDTGAAHMAALQGVPTVVIANGNRFERFFPYPKSYENVEVVYPKLFYKLPVYYNWPFKTNINQIKPNILFEHISKYLV